MAYQIRTHLMFEGSAEEAMNFYISLFPGSSVSHAEYYNEGANKGKIHHADFTLNGREFICIDSPIKHGFTFTPAMSIMVDCESVEELERLFSALSKGGETFMPLDNYGFSKRFGWTKDRFGVSWQINLP